MVKEQYVSFETSKLLKEKGFDISVYSYYSRDGELHPMNEYGNSVNFNNSILEYMERLSAPTQALVCRWLREEHNLSVEVYRTACGYISGIVQIPEGTELEVFKWNGDDLKSGKFTTWEGAYEFAIKYCIEKLI